MQPTNVLTPHEERVYPLLLTELSGLQIHTALKIPASSLRSAQKAICKKLGLPTQGNRYVIMAHRIRALEDRKSIV